MNLNGIDKKYIILIFATAILSFLFTPFLSPKMSTVDIIIVLVLLTVFIFLGVCTLITLIGKGNTKKKRTHEQNLIK